LTSTKKQKAERKGVTQRRRDTKAKREGTKGKFLGEVVSNHWKVKFKEINEGRKVWGGAPKKRCGLKVVVRTRVFQLVWCLTYERVKKEMGL